MTPCKTSAPDCQRPELDVELSPGIGAGSFSLWCRVLPSLTGRITLRDLKRCKLSHIFFDTFFNIEKYLDHEQKDPFSVIRVSRMATTRGSLWVGGVRFHLNREGLASCRRWSRTARK